MSRSKLVLLVAAAWAFSAPAFAQSSNVNSLTASGAIVGTQLFYCPIGASTDLKCTAAQVAAYNYSLMSGDCTATSGGVTTCTKTNGTSFGTLATVTPGTGVATALAVNPGTTGSFTKQNGAITTGNCLSWGPGITDAGAACGTGGGSLTVTDGTTTVSGTTQVTFNGATVTGTTPNASVTIAGGSGQTNFSTHAALISATTAHTTNTLMQQGYTASGDGGSAFYDWNASSYCPGGTGGSPTTADGLVCILPSGQSAGTTGRYLLRLQHGAIDARQLGFKDDASDNSGLVAGMNNAQFLTGAHVVFSSSSFRKQANYWFSNPLSVVTDGGISCGDEAEAGVSAPPVSLVFTAGVNGIEWLNSGAAALRGLSAYAIGDLRGAVRGCSLYSAAVSANLSGTTTNGSATTSIPFVGLSGNLAGGALQTNPNLAIGDSLAIFPYRAQYWTFTGSVSGSTLTVTSVPSPFQLANGDPGLAAGQQLQGPSVPHGIYIKKQLTGTTGQAGTYQLNYSIASPPYAVEAVPGGISSTTLSTEVQSGQPQFPPGTTITSCTTNTGGQCPPGGTMVLSNVSSRGQDWGFFLLPGPNSLQGNQQYSVTTSLTGHTFAQLTAGLSGTTLTVSAGPTLDLGQVVMGTTSIASTTITSGLTIGEYQNIPVASCTGAAGAYVVGFDGGNPIFPPGTTVASCSGGLMAVTVTNNPTTSTTSGSPVVQGQSYNTGEPQVWIGEPITGTNIPANTTVQSWAYESDDWNYFNLTLSNNASGTTTSGTWNLGGAIDAAPSSTAIFFLQGSAHVSGVSGGGVYTLDTSGSLAGGSHLYAYDTPGTMYITAGPRNLLPETPVWTDAFPFGAVAYQIYGTSPSHETALVTVTRPEIAQYLSALVAHTSGSGKMWALPSGYYRNTRGVTEGNVIKYFGIGINFAGGQDMLPSSGGDGSYDMHNDIYFSMVGRLAVGNNTGGSVDMGSEYDENWISDVAEYAGVGTAYFGTEMQSLDESFNTHVFETVCGTNSSPVIGGYASGSQWNLTCVPNQNGSMLSSQSLIGSNANGGAWSSNLWQIPFSPPVGTQTAQPAVIGTTNCAGTPSSSFAVVNGIVTHC